MEDALGPVNSVNAVTLGTGGFALATFSPFADMVALTLRIYVGSGASLGTGSWVLDSTDPSFSGFEPVGPGHQDRDRSRRGRR